MSITNVAEYVKKLIEQDKKGWIIYWGGGDFISAVHYDEKIFIQISPFSSDFREGVITHDSTMYELTFDEAADVLKILINEELRRTTKPIQITNSKHLPQRG